MPSVELLADRDFVQFRVLAYDKFVHINGWSEAVLDYIAEYEKTGDTLAVAGGSAIRQRRAREPGRASGGPT